MTIPKMLDGYREISNYIHTYSTHNKPNSSESGYNKLARLPPPPFITIIIAAVHLTVETQLGAEFI